MNIRNLFARYMESEGGEGGGAGGGGAGGGGGDWRTSLPAELQSDTALKSINSIEDLAKGYVSTSRMMGSRIPIPGKDAAPEAIKEFRSKVAGVDGVLLLPDEGDQAGVDAFLARLGRPESPDKYQIKRPDLPEGVAYDEAREKFMLERAHKAGLSTKQAQLIMDGLFEQESAAYSKQLDEHNASVTALKEKWAGAYEQNMGIAKTVLQKFGNEQLAAELDGVLGDNPGLAEFLHTLGKLTLEDTVLRNLSGGGDPLRTPEEVQAEIDEVTKNPAYMNARDPQNRALVAKAAKLFQERAKLTGAA